jgi:hypothetical protein
LKTALDAAKEAMKAETGAEEKILAGVKKISVAKDIKEVFEKVKEAHDGVAADKIAGLKEDLTKFKTEKSPAWTQINEYQKTTGKGYADEALEKLEGQKQKDENDQKEMKNAATVAEAREIGDKKNADMNSIRRSQIYITFKDAADEKTKLIKEIFAKNSVDEYKSDKDSVKKSLEDIEKHINLLEAIIKATDETTDEGKIWAKIKKINDGKGEVGETEAKKVLNS